MRGWGVLSVYAFDANGPRTVDDPDEISELIAREDTVVWADIMHPGPDDLKLIEDEFALHPLALEDAAKRNQRPKLELYEGHAYLVAYASANQYRDLDEVDIFIGPNWLVTSHENNTSGAHFDIAAVRERCERAPTQVTISVLLYTVLDEIVDSYFGAVELMGDHIDDIEERIFNDRDPETDERPIQREMLNVRKNLLGFRRKVVPLREVLLMLLRDDLPYLDNTAHHYFQDVFDHVMRITDEIDNRRELIGNAVDAHLAMVSNQMNATMKKMTSWGAILIVSTLISGIFGMNFKNMPVLEWTHGFGLSIAAMLFVTGVLYWYFKRRRWV
jgi:magnesium transporter